MGKYACKKLANNNVSCTLDGAVRGARLAVERLAHHPAADAAGGPPAKDHSAGPAEPSLGDDGVSAARQTRHAS